MSKAQIVVRFVMPAFHRWVGAVGKRAYLAEKHRHLFHVEVICEVNHDDREIEFHDLLDEARILFRALGDADGDMGGLSCEMMARTIGGDLASRHGRPFTVKVFEDGEVGAVVEVNPPPAW